MRWTEEEIELLEIWVNQGYTHKEIANELNRTEVSVKTKASRFHIKSSNNVRKTNEEYQKQLENRDLINIEKYINKNTKILHRCNICSLEWKVRPDDIVNGNKGCPKCAKKLKHTNNTYQELITGRNIQVIDNYINNHTPIDHLCMICDNTWKAAPNNVAYGKTNCPHCSKGGFNKEIPAYTYFIYFSKLNLYKIGITNNMERRFKDFGFNSELIFYRYFKTGNDAIMLEKQWLNNIKHLKVNTNQLRSGNTETFKA